uniref:C2H2-type domain-containing protein n=1 Tax=Hippocampus comes TaxID=109280 RepID=A0A3Q3E0L0_HIPCM
LPPSMAYLGRIGLHRSVNELQLHSEVLNSFPLMPDGQAQRTQPNIMDKLIEDATMSTLLDATGAPASATAADYVNYAGNIHGGAGKQLALLPAKPMRPRKHFQCLFCGKVFNYLSSLKVHVRRHSGEKPFSCTVCGKRFAQKTYLKLHQRVHSGEKPYSCPNCGRSFSQKSSLNIHFRTHTGEKPYSCVDCGKFLRRLLEHKTESLTETVINPRFESTNRTAEIYQGEKNQMHFVRHLCNHIISVIHFC